MSAYSVADARNHLSELIERALKGEEVIITRHGRPIVTLKPVAAAGRAVSTTDLDWLALHRIGRVEAKEDAASLVERMRDENER